MSNAETLKSSKLSEIWSLLETDYVPHSDVELSLLLSLCATPNTAFQQVLLATARRCPANFRVHLLEQLSQCSTDRGIRRAALADLVAEKQPESLGAIIGCASDDDPDNQIAAIKALKGTIAHQAVDLLLDRLAFPARALPPNDPSRSEDVKKAAIQSLATPGSVRAIPSLVKTMLSEPALSTLCVQALAEIGGTEVVEVLLSACEDPERLPQSHAPAFKLEAVKAIAALHISRLARGQLARLRRLLSDVLKDAVSELPTRSYVLDEVALRLDPTLLQEITRLFTDNSYSGSANDILSPISRVTLAEAEGFWLQAFEVWPPSVQEQVSSAFQNVSARDSLDAISLLERLLPQALRAHHPDRLPRAFAGIASKKGPELITAIAKVLDTQAARENAPAYMEVIWSAAASPSRKPLVDRLASGPYKTTEAVEFVSGFFSQHWADPVGDQTQPHTVFDALLDTWESNERIRPRVTTLGSAIAARNPSNPKLASLIVARAEKVQVQTDTWKCLDAAMDHIEPATLAARLATSLQSLWHPGLMAKLVTLEPKRSAPLLVLHLQGSETLQALEGESRMAALNWLGEVGNPEHFPFLRAETDRASPAIAEAATNAIASIDPNAGEPLLRELLQSRKPRVVVSAIAGLQETSAISSQTVSAIRQRSEVERNRDIQARARAAISTLLRRHLDARPSGDKDPSVVSNWLALMSSFPPTPETGVAIRALIEELGDREAPELRVNLAQATAKCCTPDVGIPLAESELQTERRPELISAWEETLDILKGSPDRGVLGLVQRVCELTIDLRSSLPPLQEAFYQPDSTLVGLVQGLRRAERLAQDPDSLVEQLDATAEILIDELLWSVGETPERFDAYSNKIGRTKAINVRAMRHAHNLHNLRELAQGPHARDASGNLRTGVSPSEAQEARESFAGLFQEAIAHLAHSRASPT